MMVANPIKRFSKFALVVLTWNLLTVLWGAYVRASGSGAGCGNHWPFCNGELIPDAQQIQTAIEFTHRLLSGGALILIGVMVVWGFRIHPRRSPVRKGLVASAIFIVSEALLGAGLVLFGWVTTNASPERAFAVSLHLVNTFLLIGSLALTAWWASGGKPVTLQGKGYLPWLLLAGMLAVIVVGMSGAITALSDTLFPAKSLAQGLAQDLAAGANFMIRVRVYHPLIAVLAGLYLIFVAIETRDIGDDPGSRRLGGLLIGVVIIQWCMGLLNYFLLVPVWTQILHLLMAELVWITLVVFSASMLGVPGTEPAQDLSIGVVQQA
jgi:heme A synthase